MKNFYRQQVQLVGTLIKRKTRRQLNYPSRIIQSNKTYIKQVDIAEWFNHHFVNVRPKLTSLIENTGSDGSTSHINKTPTNSFRLWPVTEDYIAHLFSELNENKATLDVRNKVTKFASKELSKPFTYL